MLKCKLNERCFTTSYCLEPEAQIWIALYYIKISIERKLVIQISPCHMVLQNYRGLASNQKCDSKPHFSVADVPAWNGRHIEIVRSSFSTET